VAISERLRRRIDALRVEYVKSFEDEAVGFQAEMAARDQQGVARRAHRIGGTAGSYQLDAVCSAAQNVERLCESQDGKDLARAALELQINQLCEALRAAQLLFSQAET
jgi:HPt (histidine-containing phosphotransfer) domain-containing protein